jgi:hypothetical protein
MGQEHFWVSLANSAPARRVEGFELLPKRWAVEQTSLGWTAADAIGETTKGILNPAGR